MHEHHVLHAAPDDQARASGFDQRRRKLSAAVFVQTRVLGWLVNPAASLAEMTSVAAASSVRISPQGLDQRFARRRRPYWTRCWPRRSRRRCTPIPKCRRRWRASRWCWCSTARPSACPMPSPNAGRTDGAGVERGPDPRSPSALVRAPVPARCVGDLGFWSLGVFGKMAPRQAIFVSRRPPPLRLFHARTGKPRNALLLQPPIRSLSL